MKKLVLLISVLFSTHLYSQGFYFNPPLSGTTYNMSVSGHCAISYDMHFTNGILVGSAQATLIYPDGHEVPCNGETGGWHVYTPGTYQIKGKAYLQSMLGGSGYWAYRSPYSFYVVDNYAPSAPGNLQVSGNIDSNPGLTWNANPESDIAGYNVYRKESSNSWENIAFTSSTSYTDYGVVITSVSLDNIQYKVNAVDNGSKISDFSGTVSIIATLKKGGSSTESPNEFQLNNNYPNPFNPSTVISYYLPVNSFVTLKVYDVLGHEVAELTNGLKEAGSHSIKFDASNLSSGLYIYKLTAGNYSEQKKMILMK